MGSQPVYERVRGEIAELIMDGTYSAGARLPSEASFAESLGINRLTVRRAIDELARAGLVESRQGSGTYVTKPAVRVQVVEEVSMDPNVGGITQQLRALGHQCEHRLLAATSVDPRAQRAAPDLPGSRHWRLDSSLHVDGAAWMWSRTWFAKSMVNDPVAKWDPRVSAFSLVESVVGGIVPVWKSLSAEVAGPDDAEILGIRIGFPVLVVDLLGADSSGEPIVQQSRRMRKDRFSYMLRFARHNKAEGKGE